MSINTKNGYLLLNAFLMVTASVHASEQKTPSIWDAFGYTSGTVAAYRQQVATALRSGNYTRKDLQGVHKQISVCHNCLKDHERFNREAFMAFNCYPTGKKLGVPARMTREEASQVPHLSPEDQQKLKCYIAALELLKANI